MLPSVASASIRGENSARRRKPNAAQTIASVAAPNRQRKNTTFVSGCCDDITSQPIVPDISIATTISAAPRRISFEAIMNSIEREWMTSILETCFRRNHG